MKDILSRAAVGLLERFGNSRTLVAFDFDGTLAPIVAHAERAKLQVSTRRRLNRLAALYPCAVISGRSRADVQSKVEGVPVVAVVGNHGLETGRRMKHPAIASAWRPKLEQALATDRGIEVEDKRFSLTVHFRRSRDKPAAKKLIAQALSALGANVRAVDGKDVVNVLPYGAPDKGIALEQLRHDLKLEMAIYVGDDITDEDVFELDQPTQLLSIRVGKTRRSAAPYFIKHQREIDALLDRLIELRVTP